INTNQIGEDHLSASAGHIPFNEIEEIPNHPCTQPPEGPNQLTISLRRCCVLLGGSTEPQGMEIAQQNHMQSAQSLDRFRKKRNARCFENKVRYQEVAFIL
ncbi:LOW QUALITY PROTEIN: hypothetical protein HID58_069990, partial [Brassica napus]